MADNFDMKQFLVENKLGAYSKLKENKFYSRDYVTQKYGDKAKEIEDNIHDEEDNNPNVWDLYTSLETADEVDNFVKGFMNEGEAAYEYEKGKTAGEKEEKEKLAKEDLGQDRTDAEAEKMMDFLAEKNVEEVSQNTFMVVDRIEEIVSNLARNISTNSNIPTQDKIGLIEALKELKEYVEDLGVELEMNETKKPVKEGEDIFADIEDDLMHGTDSKRDQIEYLQEVIDWCQNKIEKIKDTNMDEAMGGKNPEGDKLVLRFLKGVAKKFDYPVAQAAIFVKDTIKSLGY